MKLHGIQTLALSGALIFYTSMRGKAADADFNPEVTRALMDVFPELKSSAKPHFSVPIDIMKRWEAAQLMVEAMPESDSPITVLRQRWHAEIVVKEAVPTVKLSMHVKVFRSSSAEPVKVPVFPGNTVFESLSVNGEDAFPVQEKKSAILVFDKPGDYVIRAVLTMKPKSSGDARSLTFHHTNFVVPSVQFDSDQALGVSISDASHGLKGDAEAGTHGWLAPGSQSTFTLTWQPIREAVIRRGTLTVDPSIAWQVQDRILSANARLMIGVQGGQRRECELLLPAGADNIKATGPDIHQMQVNGRKLKLRFSRELSGRTPLNLRFDMPKPSGNSIRLPDVMPVDGRLGSTGWLVVTDDAEGQIFEQSRVGMRAASDIELPKDASGLSVGEPVLVYERNSRTASLVLDHVALAAFPLVDTIADTADLRVMVSESGAEMTRMRYMIRNNKSQFLRLTLPSHAKLFSVKVDGRDVVASRDGSRTLIPLVRSVQSLGGLVSFPVEVTYLNSGETFRAGSPRRIDLPELDGVPTASMTVRVWCPDGLHLEGVDSRLDRVARFRSSEDTLTLSEASKTVGAGATSLEVAPDALNQVAFENSLGFNYWSAGYDAYRRNDLEEAEELLANAEKYSADKTIAGNANKLLGNIRLGRGEGLDAGDQAQKAKAKNIQKSLQFDNNDLEIQQSLLIDKGLALIQQGKEELGVELLEEADHVKVQLGNRGIGKGRQTAQEKRYKSALEEVNKEKGRNIQLLDKLTVLQRKAEELTSERSSKSLIFSDELATISDKRQLSDRDVLNAAFSKSANVKPAPQQVETKARLRSLLKKGTNSAKLERGINSEAQGQESQQKASYKDQNRKLAAQVAALEEAFENTEIKSKEAPQTSFKQNKRLIGQALSTQAEAAEVTRRVQEIQTRIVGGSQGELKGKKLDNELKDLHSWASRNQNTYGQVEENLDEDLSGLINKITQAQNDLEGQRGKLKESKTVSFDISDFVQAEGENVEVQLEQFLSGNLRANAAGEKIQVSVENGKVLVANDADNLDVVFDGLSNLDKNAGSVVNVSGQQVANPTIEKNPALANLFTETTADGRKFAVLDQAQYETILEAAQLQGSAPVNATPSQRDVIVGSSNFLANEEVVVSQSGATFNGLFVGGAEVNLAHNSLLCINNGSTLTFLRADEVRDWGAAPTESSGLISLAGNEIQVPEVGQPLFFEKTLLASGESPDIVLQVKSIRR